MKITDLLCTLPGILRQEKLNFIHLSLAAVIDRLKDEAHLSAIVRHTGLSMSSVWGYLNTLNRAGLISFRHGRGRRNIPAVIYYLTPKGTKKITSIINRATSAAKQLSLQPS
jgi:DNA-binding MarR family transcriptional regulator